MKRSTRTVASMLLACAFVFPGRPGRAEAPPKALYFNDFENVPEGDVPGELQILLGMFAVKKVDGNTVVELPGDPLDGFGLIYGPPDAMAASAKFYGTSTGKRFPEFGVGLGDIGGYRVWAMPATGQLQIVKGDDLLAQVPL